MGIASMVLLQAVRAGGAPRCIQPPRPGHCLCVSLGGLHGYEMDKLNMWPCIPVPMPCARTARLMRLVCLYATCGVSPCHNGNGHE